MGDINLLPEQEREDKHSRKHRARGGIEYTSGTGDSAPAPQPLKPNPPKKPKQPSAFSRWRQARQQKKAAQQQLEKTVVPSYNKAPKHQKEVFAPDVLHDDTLLMPEEPQKHYTQPAKKSAPPAKQKFTAVSPAHLPHTPPQQPTRPSPKPHPKAPKPAPHGEQATPSPAISAGLGVNLMPTERAAKETPSHHPTRLLLIVGAVMIAMVLLAYGGLLIYKQRLVTNTQNVTQQITQLDQQIGQYAELKQQADRVNGQLQSISEVMDTHLYWTPFFSTLEELTLPTIYYKKMDATSTSGMVVLDAVAPTYQQIDAQVQLFKDSPYVKNVEVTSATRTGAAAQTDTTTAIDSKTVPTNPTAINFIMTVEFVPELFHFSQESYEK